MIDLTTEEKTLNDIFDEINVAAFDNKLPTINVKFNQRLKSTAGQIIFRMGVPMGIDLSPSVCRSQAAVRDTLAHEMCHYAQFALDKTDFRRIGHGPDFKRWAQVVMARMPGVSITTRHSYEVHKKYSWICSKCSRVNKSHTLGKRKCLKCKEKVIIGGNFPLTPLF